MARSCSIVEFPRLKISRNLGLSSDLISMAGGRWQRERSDNRDYVPSVEERKWKFWNFPQWLAEELFVTIDASDLSSGS